MSLKTEKFRALFDAAANLAGLPSWKTYPAGTWLEAVCLTESSGDPQATHFDPGHPGSDPKLWTSYGLFQIEGITAKGYLTLGTVLDFGWLFKPQINAAIAIGVLSANLQGYGNDVAKALAAYNGGAHGARTNSSGDLNDQAYVDRVETNVRAILADRA